MMKFSQNQTVIIVAIITAVGVFFGGPSLSEFFKDRSLRRTSMQLEERNILNRLITKHTELLEKYAELSGEVMHLREVNRELKVSLDAKD